MRSRELTEIEQLREATELQLGTDAGDELTDLPFAQILERVSGDIGLAADAIAQDPRPAWVAELFGPTVGLVRRTAA